MSFTIIQDGTGKSTKAKVNDSNRLLVAATTLPDIAHVSEHEGRAFQVHAERTLLSASTFENLCHFKYTGDGICKIESIMMSREDVNLNSGNGTAVFEFLINVSRVSGGVSIPPINLNRTSARSSGVTLYSGTTTLVTDETNELELFDLSVTNTHIHKFQGGLILGKGDEFTVIGKSKNIGDTLHVSIFYYETKEE